MRTLTVVGAGDSLRNWHDRQRRSGRIIAAINHMGFVIPHDVNFWMDDLRYLEKVVPAATRELIIREQKIITSKAYAEYPHAQEYPLDEIFKRIKMAGLPLYFRCTPAYILAWAIFYDDFQCIELHGCDFGTRDEVRNGERACVEFWLGVAAGRDIEVKVNAASALLETRQFGFNGKRKLYGYADGNNLIEVTK